MGVVLLFIIILIPLMLRLLFSLSLYSCIEMRHVFIQLKQVVLRGNITVRLSQHFQSLAIIQIYELVIHHILSNKIIHFLLIFMTLFVLECWEQYSSKYCTFSTIYTTCSRPSFCLCSMEARNCYQTVKMFSFLLNKILTGMVMQSRALKVSFLFLCG